MFNEYRKLGELISDFIYWNNEGVKDPAKENIKLGYPLKRIKDQTNPEKYILDCEVIVANSIEEGVLNHDKLTIIGLDEDAKRNFLESEEKRWLFAKKGDVLIKTSTPYEACCITDNDLNHGSFLISSYCIIIRNFKYPYFLTCYLNSPKVRKKLSSLATGTTAKMLNKDALLTIDILVEPYQMEKIDKEYENYIKQIQSMNKIRKSERDYFNTYLKEIERK